MSDPGRAAIESGLSAWTRGDLDALEEVLDPQVTFRAAEPGPWDCDGRDAVMALLRLRERQQPDQDRRARVARRDDVTFVVSGLGDSDETTTVVTVADGRVIAMRQVTAEARDAAADAAVAAVRAGDLAGLMRALDARPDLVGGRVPGYGGRTLLHVVADWPGYWPHGPEVVRLLIEVGADPNVRRDDDDHGESPLHWAASNDDIDVAEALLDGGADVEMPGGSIGTPLDNAVGYGCWHVAELLVQRGARLDELWHAAALGRLDIMEALLEAEPRLEAISQAFWHACAGSQRRAAQRLLNAGADLNWTPDYAEGTPLDAACGRSTRQQNVIDWLQELGARSTRPPSPSASQD
ncbi:MAG TPA: ankyrin repeat domain-containing protein [Microlunatus sp.]|nr:ankyrin repeat domain-containing protein [Microlunatus sp.]